MLVFLVLMNPDKLMHGRYSCFHRYQEWNQLKDCIQGNMLSQANRDDMIHIKMAVMLVEIIVMLVKMMLMLAWWRSSWCWWRWCWCWLRCWVRGWACKSSWRTRQKVLFTEEQNVLFVYVLVCTQKCVSVAHNYWVCNQSRVVHIGVVHIFLVCAHKVFACTVVL